MEFAKAVRIVVGVVPRQPDEVIVQAANFAQRFDAHLVCAQVDSKRYAVDEMPDGTVISLSFDPELQDTLEEIFDPVLEARIAALLDAREVAWSTRALAGDPARALGQLADRVDALMIVVGTREPTLRGNLRSFITGSVATHLAHRQHRPVLVVPLAPVGFDKQLPWDDS